MVENAFGIITSTFRVLRKPLLLEPNVAQVVVMTIISLHNYLRKSKTSHNIYVPAGSLDSEEQGHIIERRWRRETQNLSCLNNIRNVPRRASINAKDIRMEFAEYFTTIGALLWQNEY